MLLWGPLSVCLSVLLLCFRSSFYSSFWNGERREAAFNEMKRRREREGGEKMACRLSRRSKSVWMVSCLPLLHLQSLKELAFRIWIVVYYCFITPALSVYPTPQHEPPQALPTTTVPLPFHPFTSQHSISQTQRYCISLVWSCVASNSVHKKGGANSSVFLSSHTLCWHCVYRILFIMSSSSSSSSSRRRSRGNWPLQQML